MKIGAHVSIEGGLPRAVERAVAIGAECMQIFISPPQSWRAPEHSDEEVAAFKERRRTILHNAEPVAARGKQDEGEMFGPVFLHTIYLLNLVSATPVLRERSFRSLVSYLDWAHKLGVEGVITHLGSARGVGAEEAARMLPRILAGVLESAQGDVPLLLETTAGPGAVLGSRFEELAAAMGALGWPERLRVCLDTAHVFASGLYDGTAAGLDRMLAAFDGTLGLSRLMAIHLNDSKAPFGSRVDRHANIGEGLIGLDGLRPFLQHPALRHLPYILEVPGRDREGPRVRDVAAAKALAAGAHLRRPQEQDHPRGSGQVCRPCGVLPPADLLAQAELDRVALEVPACQGDPRPSVRIIEQLLAAVCQFFADLAADRALVLSIAGNQPDHEANLIPNDLCSVN